MVLWGLLKYNAQEKMDPFLCVGQKLKEEVMDDTRLASMLKEQMKDRRKIRVYVTVLFFSAILW